MTSKNTSLRDCVTAYDCRGRLPDLAAWLGDDDLKRLALWHGNRFESGEVYFDLDNPARGAFSASGSEAPPSDRTYVRHRDVPEEVWAKLITWQQPVSESQADSIARRARDLAPAPAGSIPGPPSAR